MLEKFLEVLTRIAVARESQAVDMTDLDPAAEKPTPKKAPAKKAAAKKAPAKKAAPKKKAEPEPAADDVTYDQVAKAFVELVKAGSKLGKGKGRVAALEVLEEFGLEDVPSIKDSDIDFADVRDALDAKRESL